MSYRIIAAVIITGLSGLIAQVVLLRELLVGFHGNELTLGIVLANWAVLEALGVFVLGRYADRIKSKIELFIKLLMLFSLAFPCSVYLSRSYKSILGIPFGEAVGLFAVFSISFFIILPVSFFHGALFSLACKIYSLGRSGQAGSIGQVYAWETLGVIIGGLVVTYLMFPFFSSFQIVFVILSLNLIVCFLLAKKEPAAAGVSAGRKLVSAGLFLLFWLFFGASLKDIERVSLKDAFRPGELIDYRNSVYGNIAVAQQNGQRVFFYNGVPAIVTPFSDIQFIEDFAHLPLLFHPNPEDLLIIGSGSGGLINEFLKHPLRHIDYAEIDPLLINIIRERGGRFIALELADKRVNVVNADGRFFVRSTAKSYDLILIGLSEPSDLSVNRFFTREFFSLAGKRLKPGGILAFHLPGSLTYLSRELSNLNSSILSALKGAYAYTMVIPGEPNIFLASNSSGILDANIALIMSRLNKRGIKTNLLNPDYLVYRLDQKRADWFQEGLKSASIRPNLDLWPRAVFYELVFWSRKFSGIGAQGLLFAEKLSLVVICLFLSIIAGLLCCRRNKKVAVVYAIITTGFFGMLASLMLIFSFQVFYGYLYHHIGLLISIFMAGIASGSVFVTARIKRIKKPLILLIGLDVLIIIFSCAMAFLISGLRIPVDYLYVVFTVLFFTSGLLAGAEFPLAVSIYLGEGMKAGQASGALYSADLMGGWLAGMLGGVIFLPVLGFFNACMVMTALKLSSFLLLFILPKSRFAVAIP